MRQIIAGPNLFLEIRLQRNLSKLFLLPVHKRGCFQLLFRFNYTAAKSFFNRTEIAIGFFNGTNIVHRSPNRQENTGSDGEKAIMSLIPG